MNKTLDVTNSKDFSGIKTYGNPDMWQLVCKASSAEEGWLKSTKVCNLPSGCLIQVSTQQCNNVAEALTYVPGIYFDSVTNTLLPLATIGSPYVDNL